MADDKKGANDNWPGIMDFEQCAEYLTYITGRPFSANRVKRMADNKSLPFFKPPYSKQRVIKRQELDAQLQKLQYDAVKSMGLT